MNARDEQLLSAFKAYRQVLLEPQTLEAASEELPFSERLWNVIQQRFGGATFTLLDQIWDYSIRGLGLAREGAFAQASGCFQRARSLTCAEKLGREGLLLAWSVTHGAEAYLMHRQGLFAEALRMVGVALDADEELEREFGYALLIGHRLQLVHNTVRVMLRACDDGRAGALMGAAIAFIEGYGESIPLHHSWVVSRMDSDSGWELMERQLVGELAMALATDRPALWPAFCQQVQIDKYLNDERLDTLSRDWVALKRAYLSGEVESFLTGMPYLLSQSFGRSPMLFFSVMWDYYQVLERVDSPIARALLLQLLRDSRKWIPPKGLVPLLRAARATYLEEPVATVA